MTWPRKNAKSAKVSTRNGHFQFPYAFFAILCGHCFLALLRIVEVGVDARGPDQLGPGGNIEFE